MKHEWPIDTKVGPITQALIDGKNRLLKDGWCKGTLLGYGNERCALGAIWSFPLRNEAMRELRAALPPRYHIQHYIVPEYNDLPTTTLADIIALYDRAIIRAKAAKI